MKSSPQGGAACRAGDFGRVFGEEKLSRGLGSNSRRVPEERRLLEVAELRLDGEFLSGSIGHLWNGRSTLMVHTYDATKLARLSPGRLHLLKLLQSSIERGIGIYDLSVGYLPYKESFCNTPMEMRNSVTGASLAGVPAAAAIRTGLAAKRFVKNDRRLMALVQKLRARLA